MANKELFHSNFLAWFGNQYKKEFMTLINSLLCSNVLTSVNFTLEREYKHFDICVKDSAGKEIIIIENKVKSIPSSGQLNGYKSAVNNPNCRFILLTMTNKLQNLTNANGWKVVTYVDLSRELSRVRLGDCYHSRLLEDYCNYVCNLQKIINSFDKEPTYFSPNIGVINGLGIHDICGKRKALSLYDKLCGSLKDQTIVSNLAQLGKDQVFIGWGYTNSAPYIEVKLKSGTDYIVIQIQGKQYRHAVEFFDNTIGNRIAGQGKDYGPSLRGLNYLVTNYPKVLSLNGGGPINYPFSNSRFGQKKKVGYCKYCNGRQNTNGVISCFVYQWVEIPNSITSDCLVKKIVKDIAVMKSLCLP